MKRLILAALLAAVAVPAFAQTPPAPMPAPPAGQSSMPATGPAADARAAVGKACAADFKAQCPNNQPNTPEMQACVREHFSDLSDGCRSAIMAMMAAQNGG